MTARPKLAVFMLWFSRRVRLITSQFACGATAVQGAIFYKSPTPRHPNPTQPNPTYHCCLASRLTYVLTRFQVRRIFDELGGMGMMDNTLVVLASDNGGCPSVGGSNYPYRGFKHTMFEGGVRTPALVYSKSDSIIPEEVRQHSCHCTRVASFQAPRFILRGWRTRGGVLLVL